MAHLTLCQLGTGPERSLLPIPSTPPPLPLSHISAWPAIKCRSVKKSGEFSFPMKFKGNLNYDPHMCGSCRNKSKLGPPSSVSS